LRVQRIRNCDKGWDCLIAPSKLVVITVCAWVDMVQYFMQVRLPWLVWLGSSEVGR